VLIAIAVLAVAASSPSWQVQRDSLVVKSISYYRRFETGVKHFFCVILEIYPGRMTSFVLHRGCAAGPAQEDGIDKLSRGGFLKSVS
jgi:hypothetical protein